LIFFKKSRPLLKDVIPNGYINIHSHLLPGIDDGSKNIADTIFLISKLKAMGVQQFITTPHILNSIWNNTRETIETCYTATLPHLEDTVIKPAAEYMMDSYFYDLILKEEPLLTVKDNYVLVEMSYVNPPIQLFDFIFELQVAGYKPILAHPERYLFYHNNFSEYHRLKKAGCSFQLNLLSVTGYYGNNVTAITERLLREELFDFSGTDVHHENHIKAMGNKLVMKEHPNLLKALENNSFFTF